MYLCKYVYSILQRDCDLLNSQWNVYRIRALNLELAAGVLDRMAAFPDTYRPKFKVQLVLLRQVFITPNNRSSPSTFQIYINSFKLVYPYFPLPSFQVSMENHFRKQNTGPLYCRGFFYRLDYFLLFSEDFILKIFSS